MSGNTFGKIFKITNWGESHGNAIGIVIDGCPSLLKISEKEIQRELDRRAPGQNQISTSRNEKDKVKILSGLYEGRTTGAPISMIIENTNKKSTDYEEIKNIFRPGHADFTYYQKYGIRDPSGGGRSSARITAGNVAAGAIAKKFLKEKSKTEILAYVKQVKDIKINVDPMSVKYDDIESNTIRCPDKMIAQKMIDLISDVHKKGDSVGGIIECIIKNVPIGLGDPVFDKVSSNLAKAIFSINAVKGFEIGDGFTSAEMLGSEHNDEFIIEEGYVLTKTNNAGGILGGITTGMPIIFRVAFKPTPTIQKKQKTVNTDGIKAEVKGKGRHDPCVLSRAVPVVEAMAAIVLCDLYLNHRKLNEM